MKSLFPLQYAVDLNPRPRCGSSGFSAVGDEQQGAPHRELKSFSAAHQQGTGIYTLAVTTLEGKAKNLHTFGINTPIKYNASNVN